MAEQLARTYGGSPTEWLGMNELPPARRLMLNHAILREAEEQIRQQNEQAQAGSRSGGNGQLRPGSARDSVLAKRRRQSAR